jgi:hypothetical protein
MRRIFFAFAATALLSSAALADDNDDTQDLAKKLSNPVSNLISLPLQFNYDCCYGPESSDRVTLDVQPVVPFQISDDWNLIVRTILPVIDQGELATGHGAHFGLGDTVQSFFFSPVPEPGGFIWAVGPVFLWPTGTDPAIGSGKWGAGPTALILKQQAGWTYGLLANHIWSYGGQADRTNISSTSIQPFVGFTWPDTTTLTFNSETTYDWEGQQWTVPLNLMVSHIFKLGTQATSFQIGARYYATAPADTAQWGLRFAVTFLFPQH